MNSNDIQSLLSSFTSGKPECLARFICKFTCVEVLMIVIIGIFKQDSVSCMTILQGPMNRIVFEFLLGQVLKCEHDQIPVASFKYHFSWEEF